MDAKKETLAERCSVPRQDRRNELRIAAWAAVWMGAWMAVLAGLRDGWIPGGAVGTAAAIAVSLLGVPTLLAYRRYLRRTDELQRKIQLDAVALAFGLGIVAGVANEVLETAGVIAGLSASDLVVLMLLLYPLGVLLGHRRYA